MSLNHEALKKRRAGRGGSGWKPREGVNKIRILPPRSAYIGNWEKMEDFAIPYKMHFFKIEGRQTEVTRCLEELKQPCPACNTWRAHRKSADPGLAQMAKDIAPSDQYLFNILDLNNIQAGIQQWTANYTCWDKVMEIGSNPNWGNVVDPANGVNFEINMTPGNRSRTGWNQYSVMPEPQRTTVMNILDTITDWQQQLDRLEDQITAAKEAEEIIALLTEMGFPVAGGARRAPGAAPAAVAAAPVAAAPAPAYAAPVVAAPVAPVAPAPVAPAAVAPVAPAPVAPAAVPVAPAVAVPQAVPVAVPQAAPPVQQERRVDVSSVFAPAVGSPAATATLHYDPGEGFVPVVADFERPAGAPRCYGAYDPRVHRCQPCPVIAECQMRMLDTP